MEENLASKSFQKKRCRNDPLMFIQGEEEIAKSVPE